MSPLEFLSGFLSSFFAILVAGMVIAVYNHRFIKEQRRREVADAFCSNMERHLDDYFNDAGREQSFINMRVNAYVTTFLLFWGDEKFSDTVRKDIKDKMFEECFVLLDLDNEEITREERLRRSLLSVARIRYFLTV